MRLPGNQALQGATRRAALLLGVVALVVAPMQGAGAVNPADSADEGVPTGATSSSADASDADEAVEVLEDLEESLAAAAEPQPFSATPGAGASDVDLTSELASLAQVYDDLPDAATRRRADRLLARPTGAGGDLLVNYGNQTVKDKCNTRICVHWVEGGKHRATASWADKVFADVNKVWTAEVTNMGYKKPASDGNSGNPPGVSGHRLDVYIGNISDQGYYGYAVLEKPKKGSAYLVVDNDYANLGGRPSLQVTAAHEFFHVLQFGYQPKAELWIMEATATWIEEQVFDAINDNRQYLQASALTKPGVPLTKGYPYFYGNWIFFEHLSQRYSPALVRVIWNQIAKGKPAPNAINRALKKRGSDLKTEFTRFAAANTVSGKTYSEGSAYPKAKPAKKPKLGKAKKKTPWQKFSLNHLSATTVRYVPQGALGKKFKLKIGIKGPKRVRAEVMVLRTDGTVARKQVVLKNGKATKAVAFTTTRVKWASVTVANTGVKPKHNKAAVQVRGVLKKKG